MPTFPLIHLLSSARCWPTPWPSMWNYVQMSIFEGATDDQVDGVGVDLNEVTPTGLIGDITREDVIRHADQAKVFHNIETPQ